MSAKTYKSKPKTIEAIQYSGDNFDELRNFAGKMIRKNAMPNVLHVMTNHGVAMASKGDFIIKSPSGEFYPCKEEEFLKNYQEA